MKRLFDILFASFCILLLILPMFLIYLLIVIDSNGPAIFKQKRIGLNGIPFTLLKFRSMSVNRNIDDNTFQAGDISRVTSIGKLLRKTKLDELPQLFNVIYGDMSIVGPRPEVEKWTKVYPEKWAIIHTVKPGITDNAAIKYRNEETILLSSLNPDATYEFDILPKKLDLYLDYISNQSLLSDILIIYNTIKATIFK